MDKVNRLLTPTPVSGVWDDNDLLKPLEVKTRCRQPLEVKRQNL
jgi:hypothetical protein